MRCYLAEHGMSWERGMRISEAGTRHCHGIRMASKKGFMLTSLGNPHIYISPCSLLNYARLLDYFDDLISIDYPGHSEGQSAHDAALSSASTSTGALASFTRHEKDLEVYLWAIDRLRKQVLSLGATPVVELPDPDKHR